MTKISKLYNLFFKKINCIFIEQIKKKIKISSIKKYRDISGNHALLLINNNYDPKFIKKYLVEIENIIGDVSKFIDVDLMISKDKFISREELNITKRKCFICNKEAKVCSRNQNHSYEKLIEFINCEIEDFIKGDKKYVW